MMPKRIGGKTTQITIRLGADHLRRLKALSRRLGCVRADTLREIVERGLAALEGPSRMSLDELQEFLDRTIGPINRRR